MHTRIHSPRPGPALWPWTGRLYAALLGAALAAVGGKLSAADAMLPTPNWTLQSAREATSGFDTLAELKPLFALARAGDDTTLLHALQGLAGDQSLPAPAREFVLLEFARGLSDLPPRQPSPELAAWLLAWQPQTRVPHEEAPGVGRPLYNVAAAAAGSFNYWRRELAASDSEGLLSEGPEAWLAAWLAAEPARRSGLADALEPAPAGALRAVAESALERLHEAPELGSVTTRIALRLADPALFAAALMAGDSSGLATALREAGTVFDDAERAAILEQAVRIAPSPNAALALAELGPGLDSQPQVQRLLFDLLGDVELGAAASLVLAGSSEPLVLERLDELAAQGRGLAARRAALAQTMRGDARGPERRP